MERYKLLRPDSAHFSRPPCMRNFFARQARNVLTFLLGYLTLYTMNRTEIYGQVIAAVLRLLNQMNQMENIPKSFRTDVQIHPSEIHTIAAIGDHPGCNISELARVGWTFLKACGTLENRRYRTGHFDAGTAAMFRLLPSPGEYNALLSSRTVSDSAYSVTYSITLVNNRFAVYSSRMLSPCYI
ncbi:hypothetical protein ES703_121950 [subsurface metagenome]